MQLQWMILAMDTELIDLVRAGAAIVTASQRLSRALRDGLNRAEAQSGKQVWEAPSILPWSAFLQDLWDKAAYSRQDAPPLLLNGAQEVLIWEQAIETCPEADGLLDIAATARAARESWSTMNAWRLERFEVERDASEDTLAFLRWSDRFQAICRENRWLDGGRMPDCLSTRLASVPLPARIVFAGFDDFTAQQAAFLRALSDAGAEVTIAPAGKREPGAGRRIACADSHAELRAAAHWARELIERGAPGSIAVAVRDLQNRRAAAERIFGDTLEPGAVLPGALKRAAFNISAPPALASYALVRSALLILKLDIRRNEFSDISALLRSPYLHGAAEEHGARALLETRLRRGGIEIAAGRLQELAAHRGCPKLAALLAGWRKQRETLPAAQSPSGWARSFAALLRAAGFPGEESLGSAEYQVYERWRELLSEFSALEAVRPRMSNSEALSRLERLAGEALFQPEGSDAPVQILGHLEMAGLRFDHVWMAGFDDGAWPAPARPDPFLPLRLQRERGTPHSSPDRELAFARTVTKRLLASAPDVVVSHSVRDGDTELGPSPLIVHVPEGREAPAPAPQYADVIRQGGALDSVPDSSGPPLESAATSGGGTRIFQYQALCPFKAFVELRLGAEPLEEPAAGLNPAERGQLVHLALAEVWTELKTHARLSQATDEVISDTLRRAIQKALDEVAERRGVELPARFAAIERTRLEVLLREWLDLEEKRAPFEVVEIESQQEVAIGGIRAIVKVDRVDRVVRTGRDIIIDYKTGAQRPSGWEGDRPEEPQLPVYATAHETGVAAVLFAKVRAGELKFAGVAAEPGLVPGVKGEDLAEHMANWQRSLERLATDFRAGVATVSPKHANTCRTCSLAALCRINEADLPTSVLEGGD